jgi:putative transposase
VDLGFRPLFAFVVVELGSRRVMHVGTTRHPTDVWVAQQLREATPFDERPRFLVRDNDRKYGPAFDKYGPAFDRVAAGSRITVLRTPIRSPRANATCERFLGSVRREYVAYFNQARPHQGRGQAIPSGPVPLPGSTAPIVAIPVLGGLHHDYRRAA